MEEMEKEELEREESMTGSAGKEADGGAGGNAKDTAGKVKDASGKSKEASEKEDKESPGDDSASSGGKDKKKLFDKKKKPDKRDEKIKELEDRSLRQMAEFENFRKRTEKEKSQMYDMGARSVIEKILPVIDNFERGLATLSEEQKKEPFAEGIDKVYTQLMTELKGLGVTPIDALGCEFDPELHNAVMQTESDEYESGQVAQELQKGYKYHDMVVRHSMVAVVS